jgi:hypothetical protein
MSPFAPTREYEGWTYLGYTDRKVNVKLLEWMLVDRNAK